MKARYRTLLDDIQQAIISGNAAQALARIDLLTKRFEGDRLTEDDKAQIEPTLHHLRRLAEDSARGTQRAIDQIREILQTARTLQTYDRAGRRRQTATDAALPQRF